MNCHLPRYFMNTSKWSYHQDVPPKSQTVTALCWKSLDNLYLYFCSNRLKTGTQVRQVVRGCEWICHGSHKLWHVSSSKLALHKKKSKMQMKGWIRLRQKWILVDKRFPVPTLLLMTRPKSFAFSTAFVSAPIPFFFFVRAVFHSKVLGSS